MTYEITFSSVRREKVKIGCSLNRNTRLLKGKFLKVKSVKEIDIVYRVQFIILLIFIILYRMTHLLPCNFSVFENRVRNFSFYTFI